jgi:Tol biopolymer transport system component
VGRTLIGARIGERSLLPHPIQFLGRFCALAAVVAVFSVKASPGAGAQGTQAKTILVSRNSSGEPADQGNLDPSISRDGRFVAFTSWAQNLPGGEATQPQIYVRDLEAGTTRLVSKNSSGKPAGGGAFLPAISADGRYVAFRSSSSNLPGGNGIHDQIYLRNLAAGTTRLVSKNSAGEPADRSADNPSISGSGRFVAFDSGAFNMPGDDWTTKVLVHDKETGKTTLASRTSGGEPAQGSSYQPSVSSDGSRISFTSNAQNLPQGNGSFTQVYVRDRAEGTTALVSKTTGGEPANDFAAFSSISPGGGHVVFGSRADNLPGGDGGWNQLYMRALATGTTTLVSRASGGEAGAGDSYDASVSGTGRFVSFASTATNLPGSGANPQVYVRDRANGTTLLVSKDAQGQPAAGTNELTAISRDGRYIAFDSNAGNLPAGDGSTFRVYSHGPI